MITSDFQALYHQISTQLQAQKLTDEQKLELMALIVPEAEFLKDQNDNPAEEQVVVYTGIPASLLE